MSPENQYAAIADALLRTPDVTIGSGKKGFGSSALQVNGKIFAMLSSDTSFVVKLPKQRVDELIEDQRGERFNPGHGRLMKEWLVVYETSMEQWPALAEEALAFVGSKR